MEPTMIIDSDSLTHMSGYDDAFEIQVTCGESIQTFHDGYGHWLTISSKDIMTWLMSNGYYMQSPENDSADA